MTNKKTRIFLGQLYEHEGKFGTYYTGPFAAGGRLYIERSKEPGKWNMYLAENEKRDAKPKQNGFEDRLADDGLDPIPF